MNWYDYLYRSFIITSIVLFIISLWTINETSINSIIAGHSILIVGILMVLFQVIKKTLPTIDNLPILKLLTKIISITGPFTLLLGIIGTLLYLIITYKKLILNHVSNNYSQYNNISLILLIMQTFLILKSVNSDYFKENQVIPKIINNIIYLIGTINVICVFILFTILKFYSTDG